MFRVEQLNEIGGALREARDRMSRFSSLLLFIPLIVLSTISIVHGHSYEDGEEAAALGKFKRAAEILLPLARQGNLKAQRLLSHMYISGETSGVDVKSVLKWLEAEANGNFIPSILKKKIRPGPTKSIAAKAEVGIGLIYYYGLGVAADYPRAASWFRRSVESINRPEFAGLSQLYLGKIYMNGDPLEYKKAGSKFGPGESAVRDDVLAYMWLSIAKLWGVKPAKDVLAQLIKRMDPEDVEAGRGLAVEWLKKSRVVKKAIREHEAKKGGNLK